MWRGVRGWAQVSAPSPESSVPSRHLSLRPDGLRIPEPCARSLGSSQPGVGLRSLLGGGDLLPESASRLLFVFSCLGF